MVHGHVTSSLHALDATLFLDNPATTQPGTQPREGLIFF